MAASDSVASNLFAEHVAPTRDRAISESLLQGVVVLAEASADFVICAGGLLAAYVICEFSSIHSQNSLRGTRQLLALSVVCGVLTVFLGNREGSYSGSSGLLQIRETERAIRCPTQALFLLSLASALLKQDVPWMAFVVAFAFVPCVLMIEKHIFAICVSRIRQKYSSMVRVVVYGAGESGRSIASTLSRSSRLGFHPVAVIDDSPGQSKDVLFEMGYRRLRSIAVDREPVSQARLKSCHAEMLMIAVANLPRERVDAATRAAHEAGVEVSLVYGPTVQEGNCFRYLDIDGLFLASTGRPCTSFYYAIVKRVADLLLSLFLLAALAPLFILIAILIRLDSPGPVFIAQKRIGRNGRVFNMYKSRSMHADAFGYDPSPTSSDDPRITRVGRFLRWTSLDELPQLANVVLGDMSLVGPRPEMPFIVEGYTSDQRQRLQVTPGITGLWQLSADRAFPIHENLHYDLYYIRNRSLSMDLAILIHTLFFAVGRGI